MNFAKTLAVVTGGASGIGRACAEFIAARGGRVVVVDRRQEAARAAADAVGGYACVVDVADEIEVQRAEAELFARHGATGILINSAGVLQRTLPPEQLTLHEVPFLERELFRRQGSL